MKIGKKIDNVDTLCGDLFCIATNSIDPDVAFIVIEHRSDICVNVIVDMHNVIYNNLEIAIKNRLNENWKVN